MTLAEAKKRRYGVWAGRPKGTPYDSGRCAYEIYNDATMIARQCSRTAGQGLNGLFCYQHAIIVQKEIEGERQLAEVKSRSL